MKTFLVAAIDVEDLSKSFLTKVQAESHLKAIENALAKYRKFKQIEISSLHLNDNAYCTEGIRIFVTEL